MSIKVMSRVWEESAQKGSALLLLLALADHAADDGYCWPNVTTLAKKIRLSVRTVYRLTDALEGAGELVVVRHNRNNRYVVRLGMTDDEVGAVLTNRKESIGDTTMSPIAGKGDKMTRDIAVSPTGDMGVTSEVTQLCHPNHHEPSSNRQKEGPSSDDFSDLDWHTGTDTPTGTGVAAFVSTGDPVRDILAASDLKKRRGIPDWAVLGAEGVHPAFAVVRAFCDLTGQDVGALTDSEGKDWLRAYATMERGKGVTMEQLAEAHRILPNKEWGDWHLSHHKWGSPRAQSYAEMVVLAARQLQDGELAPANVIKVELW